MCLAGFRCEKKIMCINNTSLHLDMKKYWYYTVNSLIFAGNLFGEFAAIFKAQE